jgi:hypothetical protein
MLAHSGGLMGLLLGGASELFAQGLTPAKFTPYKGMGYGTAAGLLAAGALATQVTVSPSRVLLVDVGIGGGALVGAAAASPLIFQNVTENKTRGWLGVTIGGALVGGALTYYLTRDMAPARAAWLEHALPMPGILGASETPQGSKPIYGLSWASEF